jgi:hypothetical protein
MMCWWIVDSVAVRLMVRFLHLLPTFASVRGPRRLRGSNTSGINGRNASARIVACHRHHNSERQSAEILLIRDIPISGEAGIEPPCGNLQKLAIFQAGPTVPGYRCDRVTAKTAAQSARQRFVKQDAHSRTAPRAISRPADCLGAFPHFIESGRDFLCGMSDYA